MLLPLLWSAALLAGLLLLVLVLIDPVWALYVAVLSVPLQEHIYLPGGLTCTQGAVLLATGAWGLQILAYPERRVYGGRVLLGLLALVFALALATSTTPYNQTLGFKETARWLIVIVIYLLALNSIVRPHISSHTDAKTQRLNVVHTKHNAAYDWRVMGLVFCLIFTTFFEAVVGLWQFVTGTGPPGFLILDEAFARSFGTIGQPNSFAGYLNMGWPLAFALACGAAWMVWIHYVQYWVRLQPVPHYKLNALLGYFALLSIAGVAAGIVLAALMTSLSRGGWLGAMGAGGAMFLALVVGLQRQQRQRIGRWLGIAGVCGILLFPMANVGFLPDILVERISSITRNLRLFDARTVEVTEETFAVVERMSHLQAGWSMFLDHPVTGVGPGNYSIAYEGRGLFEQAPYAFDPWYASRGHAHNYYLHIAAEAGIIGAFAYALLLIVLVVQAFATLRTPQHWFLRSIAVGCCGIMGSVAVHNLFENLHVLNMGVQLGAVWGLLAALEIRQQTESS